MRAKIWAFVGLIIFLSAFAYAEEQNIDIRVKTITGSISGSEQGLYNVTITNLLGYDDYFRVTFADDIEWIILTDPLNYKFSPFRLWSGQSASFLVTIRPNPEASLPYKTYSMGMIVRGDKTQETSSGNIVVGYGPQFGRKQNYPPLVVAKIEMPERVDPRKVLEIRLHLVNKNPLNITKLNVILDSKLFKQETSLSLEPKEEKTVVFSQLLDPLETPKQDTLKADLIYEGSSISTAEKIFEIIPYSTFEEQQDSLKESFYKTTIKLSYKNNGNIGKKEIVLYETDLWKILFTHTTPRSRLLFKNGHQYLSWDIELLPDQKLTLGVTEDFLAIPLIIFLAIIVLVVYCLLRSPLSAYKEATLIAKKEGGIAGLKVIITIKNRSRAKLHDVEVVDSIPNIFGIDKRADMGAVTPTKVVEHADKGMLIKWKMGDLEKGDERVLSYRAHARLTILGSFVLPASISRYVYKYKERLTYSNRIKIKL